MAKTDVRRVNIDVEDHLPGEGPGPFLAMIAVAWLIAVVCLVAWALGAGHWFGVVALATGVGGGFVFLSALVTYGW